MEPNPLLKKLGFANSDRVAILHTDDIGMCQASVAAFADLFEFGLISSGAVMMPCPWSLAAAAYCRLHPEVDMGIHLTLTSEWSTYRWKPLSTTDLSSGLIDEEGFFHHRSEEVAAHGSPDAALCEMQAQVMRAKAAGIKPSHIDTHMGTVAHPKFIPGYIQIAMENRLPPMIFRMDEAGWREEVGMEIEQAAVAAQFVRQLEDLGVPMLDHMAGMPLDDHENRLERAKRELNNLKPGITHFILHPSKDTPELRAITPDWRARAADYDTFSNENLRRYIRQIGIQIIGYRAIQEAL
jgi:chitin disaccharide deacetylase